jgi:hypothetical protein
VKVAHICRMKGFPWIREYINNVNIGSKKQTQKVKKMEILHIRILLNIIRIKA